MSKSEMMKTVYELGDKADIFYDYYNNIESYNKFSQMLMAHKCLRKHKEMAILIFIKRYRDKGYKSKETYNILKTSLSLLGKSSKNFIYKELSLTNDWYTLVSLYNDTKDSFIFEIVAKYSLENMKEELSPERYDMENVLLTNPNFAEKVLNKINGEIVFCTEFALDFKKEKVISSDQYIKWCAYAVTKLYKVIDKDLSSEKYIFDVKDYRFETHWNDVVKYRKPSILFNGLHPENWIHIVSTSNNEQPNTVIASITMSSIFSHLGERPYFTFSTKKNVFNSEKVMDSVLDTIETKEKITIEQVLDNIYNDILKRSSEKQIQPFILVPRIICIHYHKQLPEKRIAKIYKHINTRYSGFELKPKVIIWCKKPEPVSMNLYKSILSINGYSDSLYDLFLSFSSFEEINKKVVLFKELDEKENRDILERYRQRKGQKLKNFVDGEPIKNIDLSSLTNDKSKKWLSSHK